MLQINRHILDNGLRLVHAQDTSTQMVALNILYNVGARDENPEHTGFAHLFEHLMFGGSGIYPIMMLRYNWQEGKIMLGPIMTLPIITSLYPDRMWKPDFGLNLIEC